MKKILSFILSLSVSSALLAGTAVSASDNIAVEIDGKKIEFDVKPEIVDGRTMVPLRKIFEELGAFVKWNGDTRTVSARKNKKTVTLVIDSADMQLDKGKTDEEGNPVTETITLDVPAQIVSGRTLVPARAISESFGLNVEWDENNNKVIITSDEEEDNSWEENIGSVNLSDLSFEGEGIEIAGNQIKIVKGGDYTVTGILKDGNITVSAKEKVKLRLNGAEISSGSNPCIFVEDADKAYITLVDGTENNLVAENSEDGAIYSKENLEIKGNGSLVIESKTGHGIKASDNMIIENGNITINAVSDGIHINDTFKMRGGTVNITATGDGIDSESIIDISGGKINIETNGTPIETPETETTQEQPRRMMWEETPGVEFEKSTKGINSEWMMCISGGEININSASHTIHCQDEIEITGGIFALSSVYDKGISAHGNLTISGSETTIDIKKSVEGLESKNVMTINDGVIKVVSTDDALNATGGSSGMMMPPPNFDRNTDRGNRQPRLNTENAENNSVDANLEMPESGWQMPQFEMPEGGWQMPQFEMPEGGWQMPQFEMPEGGWQMPQFEMPEGGWQMPQFEMPEGGWQMPQFEMPESGEADPPRGFGGWNRGNMKTCLVINGGYLEACGSDDCIDANGNMIINGGTVKAVNPTGAFTGNFGVLDADGQITIDEDANIILASNSGSEKSLKSTQNTLVVYCENKHEANEAISVSDSSGNVIYEYSPAGSYKSVLITSSDIQSGEKYLITIGNETFEAEITQQVTVVGTPQNGGMGFGRGQRMQ